MSNTDDIDNVMNCAKAEKCKEMSLKCAQTYKASNRPWGNLTECYSLKGNNLMNSLGTPEQSFTVADFKNCSNYFSGKNPCIEKEGFTAVANPYFVSTDEIDNGTDQADTAERYNNLNSIIDQINDTGGNNRTYIQNALDKYVEMKEKREKLQSQLDEMNSTNTDINLETSSIVYTTLFTTALGTCLLYYFIKMQ
uniref:Uncharacterized protein n=1 Tax=viral metagenome TaxID=1070528 RepID=A0A6C0HI46_9ZZZZ